MGTMCSMPSKPDFNCWALISSGKLHRVTFSKNLAEFMLTKPECAGMRLERLKFRRGRALQPGERSASGLYLITNACARPLRISLFYDAAQCMTDWENRFLYECWVKDVI